MLNENNKIFENAEGENATHFPMPEDSGFDTIEDEDDNDYVQPMGDDEIVEPIEGEVSMDGDTVMGDENSDIVIENPESDVNVDVEDLGQPVNVDIENPVSSVDVTIEQPEVIGNLPSDVIIENPADVVDVTLSTNDETIEPVSDVVVEPTLDENGEVVSNDVQSGEVNPDEIVYGATAYESRVTDMTSKIDALLEKVKIQAAVKNTDYNFLKFLNKPQVDAFYELAEDDKQKVIVKMEESEYWTSRDVLRIMNESLSKPTETFEERLIRLLPTTVKDIFDSLDEKGKKHYLLQAKLHPNLNTDLMVEHFWVSRDWSALKPINEGKTLLDETKNNFDDKLSDAAVLSIINRMKQL